MHILRLLVPSLLALAVAPSGAEAARTFRSGAVAVVPGGCSGSSVETVVAYEIEPALETPNVGEVINLRATLTNRGGCSDEVALVEVILPADAALAPGQRHTCAGGALVDCSGPVGGSHGGQLFASATIPRGTSFAVTIPIRFTRPVENVPVSVVTIGGFATTTAAVAVDVPFQDLQPASRPGDDIVVLGSPYAFLGVVPIAFARGDGTFGTTSYLVADFAEWAKAPGVKRVSGDFNGDTYTDFALVGGPGWTTIPVAQGRGDGRFVVTNFQVGSTFGSKASEPGVTALTGDFDNDHRTDIALVGGANWTTLPMAFSRGYDGEFDITNMPNPEIAGWSDAQLGAKAVTGDFDRDGRTDIALVGGFGWNTLPFAHSNGRNGTFNVTNPLANKLEAPGGNLYIWNFAASARDMGNQVFTGDFNRDGYGDIGIAGGGAAWSGIRIALGRPNGQWSYVDRPMPNFGSWARAAGVKIVAADFNRDEATDFALMGGPGWNTLPVAFASGQAAFTESNQQIGGGGQFNWQARKVSVRALTGDFNGDGSQDIALVGDPDFRSIPTVVGSGNGYFYEILSPSFRLPVWAASPQASVFVGKLN